MPQVTLEQATIDYHVLGPADSPLPPVLFIHGILVDHRLWRKAAEQLARKGFRCILPDWPLGSHRIPVNDGADLSPEGVAMMIRDFVVALGLSDVTLVGNDTGGGLCQLVVDAYPEQVGRLVLTNCDAFDKFPPFPFDAVFALLRGPKSIRTLFATMRVKALRHSPLGYRAAATRSRSGADGLLAATVPFRRTHLPRPRDAAAARREDRSDRRVDPPAALHQARDPGVGPGRPLFHAVTRPTAGATVPQLHARRGAGRQNFCGAGRPRGSRRRDREDRCTEACLTTTASWPPAAAAARRCTSLRHPARSALLAGELADVGVAVAEQLRAAGQVLHVPLVDLFGLDRDGLVLVGLQRGGPFSSVRW